MKEESCLSTKPSITCFFVFKYSQLHLHFPYSKPIYCHCTSTLSHGNENTYEISTNVRCNQNLKEVS